MNNDFFNYYEPVMEPMIQLPNTQEEELCSDKDLMYMRRLYPDIAKEIVILIDEECDKLEYEGSYMFHECPDKQHIIDMTDRVLNQLNISAQSRDSRCDGRNDFLCDLVNVLILDNMLHRRHRHHRRRSMFYPERR